MPDPLPADLAARDRRRGAAARRVQPRRVSSPKSIPRTTSRSPSRGARRAARHGDPGGRAAGRPRPAGPRVVLAAWRGPVSVRRRPAGRLAGALSLVTLAAGVAVARGLSVGDRAGARTEVAERRRHRPAVAQDRRHSVRVRVRRVRASTRVVVGIGVNLRRSAFPPEIADRASAIEMETDRPVDAAACVVEILAAVEP